jgi:site-specific recombinase XerD
MAKSGQARVLTPEQFAHLLNVVRQHRHPEKNTALLQVSYKLGLRVQEIALLQIKEVARLSPVSRAGRAFTLHQIMPLPAAYTKGADALQRGSTGTPNYERRTVSFKRHDFDQLVRQIERLARAGVAVNPQDFYPQVQQHKGKSRDLPMEDPALRAALHDYLQLRLSLHPQARATDPLFITQKGGAYSPNTLQEHLALMQRDWAGIERASSHSGRRTLLTDIIHRQGKSVKVAQKIAGHVSAATTLIYEEPPEESLRDALLQTGQSYTD